ncbi:hypothetical protein C8R48DRAFT_771536 [Suillus tomentosus]|nr:hypothetical protein C8R48DRAFT_771536 [Suillus tomentosus]
MTQPTYAALPNGVSQGQFLPPADKFNLEVTVTELMFIEHALVGRVDKKIETLPLLNRVQYLLSLPPYLISHESPLIGDSRDQVHPSSDSEVGLSSEDEVYPSYSYAACYKIPSCAADCDNITSSPGSVFHESLSFDEEISDSQHTDPVDDSILDDETGCYADEDYAAGAQNNCSDDNYADENYTDDDFDVEEEEMLNGHQRRVAFRKLRRLHRHPYTPTGTAVNPRVVPFQPDCPRNGRRLHAPPRWQAQATSITSNSFITSDALIAVLASARVDSTSSSLNVQSWVANSTSYLKDPGGVELAGGSLEQTIARCHLISIQTAGSSLVAMITYMQLAIQCQSIIHASTATEKYSIRRIYNDQVAKLKNAPSEHTFQRWNENGCKFIILAAGGSFFLLVIIAGLEIRWKITTIRFEVLRQVAKMLRQPGTTSGKPESSVTPQLITNSIIPTIAWIRCHMPICLRNIFCLSFLTSIGVGNTIDCTDLSLSDKVFDGFKQHHFSLPTREIGAWAICVPAVTEQRLVIDGKGISSHLPSMLDSINECRGMKIPIDVTVIQTSYDRKHRSNIHFPAKTNRRENIIWTEGERAKAEVGEVVKDIDDLRSKLDNLYINGCRTEDRYLRIPMSILQGGGLDLRNSDGSLMAFVCLSLPEDIRCGLTSSLLACFDGKEVLQMRHKQDYSDVQDSDDVPEVEDRANYDLEKLTEQTLSSPFQCLHFSLWNRYSTTASPPPIPLKIQHENDISYRELMKTHLPEEYEVIIELSHNLPGGECSPVAPFLSIVINLNVTTEAHRDRFDKDLCLVLPIGKFKAGALVHFEQGLVLELRCGDFVIFPSDDTTHFNLHYEGKRASFVFHTDKGFDKWKNGCNGWAINNHFH